MTPYTRVPRTAQRPRRAPLALLAVLLAVAALLSTALAQTTGGRLVIARGDPPTNLDPHKTGEAAADQVNVLIGGGLMVLDPDTLAVTPWLAESYTQSDDGLVFTFTLMQGVTFHNGDPLTASDWKYTFERALDPATQATVSRDMLGSIASIEAPDDYTLVVTLAEPSAVFLRNLSSAGYLMPLSQRAVEAAGDNYSQNPVGVGPYRFKEWITGYSITVERNPDFAWPPFYASNRGAAYLDEIEIRYIPEAGTLVAALETGEIDLAVVGATDLFLFEDNPGFEVASSLRTGIGLLFMFNMEDEVMSDLRVRQAFSLATSKDFIIERAIEGRGVAATGPLPQSLPGYDPASADTDYDFDLEAAAALLDEAGWVMGPNGIRAKDGQPLRVRLVAYSVGEVVTNTELLQNQLQAVGVDAVVESYERGLQTQMLRDGDYQIAPLGWTYGDPDVLFLLYHSTQIASGLNFGKIADDELDAVLEAGRTTVVDAERMVIYHDAQRIMNENAYIMPIYVPETYSVYNARVKDIRFAVTGGWLMYDIWIDR